MLIERGSEVGGGDVRTTVGTVARIVEVAEPPDGRFALVAVGTRRIRVAPWLPDDPYPDAEVEDWPDDDPDGDFAERLEAVVARLRRVLALRAELGEPVAAATTELARRPAAGQLPRRGAGAARARPTSTDLLDRPGPGRARCGLLDELLGDAEVLARVRSWRRPRRSTGGA